MSMAIERRGGSGPPRGWAQDCDDKHVYVEVDGVEIPTTEVEGYITTDGATDIQRLAKVKFPSEWMDRSVADYIKGFSESDSGYSKANVYFADARMGSDSKTITHYGHVGAVGGASETGVLKFWVYDPYEFMESIPVSQQFYKHSIEEVLSFVASEFQANSIFSSVSTRTQGDASGAVGGTTIKGDMSLAYGGGVTEERKTFEKNKHTLIDVMDWLSDLANARWYFYPRQAGTTLVLDINKNYQEYDEDMAMRWREQPDADSIKVIENTALSHVNPINTLTVYGETAGSLSGLLPQTPPSGKYPYAIAQHPDLLEQADGYVAQPAIEHSDKKSVEGVEGEAARKLKKAISESGEGTITCLCTPWVNPFDILEARPTCQGRAEYSAPPMEWEIQEVKFTKTAGTDAKMDLYCSLAVREEDIVVESGMEDA